MPFLARSLSWLLYVAYGLLYVASAELGHYYSIEPGHMATFWPPAGLYLAALVVTPARHRVQVIAVSFLANLCSDWLLHQKTFGMCLGFATANTCEAVGGWFLIHRLPDARAILHQFNGVKRLIITSFAAPIVGATLGVATIRFSFPRETELWQDWLVWWIADVVGILVVTPITIACATAITNSKSITNHSKAWTMPKLTECLLMLIVIFGLVELIFSETHPSVSFTFLLIPALLWPSLRFGTVAVGITSFLIALLVAGHTIQGTGPFSDEALNASQRATLVQSFIAAVTAPFLALAALIHERDKFAEELEEKILQRTMQLNEADQRKDHFLAVLAHELRNPIAPLSNSLSVWPMVMHDHDAMNQLREIMSRQMRHIVRLVDDLLDVSRITRGKIQLQSEILDLRDVIRDATDTVHPMIESACQQLEVELPPSKLMVKADRARLLQIIGNLLNNASKYTGRDGKICLSAAATDDAIQVQVQDNGPGIPPDQLDRIFDMFTQVDQTLERSHGGLGIGLTLARRLIELHDGTIHAKSDGPGLGSTFTITLPALIPNSNDAASSCGATAESIEALALGKANKLPRYHIVVVDDAHESAQTLAMMLQSLGQHVTIVYDGQTAIDAIHRIVPQIAFVDIAMPGMNGYDVACTVKKMQANKSCHTMLIALTGFGQEHDRRRAFAAGFDHHLIKPASFEKLNEIIRTRA